MNVKIYGSSGGLKVSVAAEGCRSYLSKIDVARIVSRGFFGKDAQKNRLFLGFFAKLMLKFATKPLCVFRCFFKNHLNNCKHITPQLDLKTVTSG